MASDQCVERRRGKKGIDMNWKHYFDKEFSWTIGCDLNRWMIGVVWFWGGFCISIGPFYLEHSDAPF